MPGARISIPGFIERDPKIGFREQMQLRIGASEGGGKGDDFLKLFVGIIITVIVVVIIYVINSNKNANGSGLINKRDIDKLRNECLDGGKRWNATTETCEGIRRLLLYQSDYDNPTMEQQCLLNDGYYDLKEEKCITKEVCDAKGYATWSDRSGYCSPYTEDSCVNYWQGTWDAYALQCINIPRLRDEPTYVCTCGPDRDCGGDGVRGGSAGKIYKDVTKTNAGEIFQPCSVTLLGGTGWHCFNEKTGVNYCDE